MSQKKKKKDLHNTFELSRFINNLIAYVIAFSASRR